MPTIPTLFLRILLSNKKHTLKPSPTKCARQARPKKDAGLRKKSRTQLTVIPPRQLRSIRCLIVGQFTALASAHKAHDASGRRVKKRAASVQKPARCESGAQLNKRVVGHAPSLCETPRRRGVGATLRSPRPRR